MRVSRFNPLQTPREQLEQLFVAREDILDDVNALCLQAVAGESHVHTLIVGPRGAGKTHLLAMLYFRLEDAVAVGVKLQIARLPEDPITITSYPRLLAAIVTAAGGQPASLRAATLELELDQLADEGGVIVVLVENLDEIFTQIGTDGQRKLRHYLQTSQSLLLMATTSVLDRSFSETDSPFYGYFSVIKLQPLSIAQAQQMLAKLARVRDDEQLARYLESELAAKRLRIVSELAGSHPRIWSTFSEVLTPANLQDIGQLLYANFDDLTPYYRDRVMSLAPQQRLVFKELAAADHPLHVQQIAEGAQLDERSTSRTAGELKKAGWIQPVESPLTKLADGRRTYYELSEPLARLAFQAKETIGKPVELIISFLSVWFDPEEVARWGSDNIFVEQVRDAFDSDGALRMTRWLSSLSALPASKAGDVERLGELDDALADVQAGDFDAIMALPSEVRRAAEDLCAGNDADVSQGVVELRRRLHRGAMDYMGWVPHEPQSSEWIARGENLAKESGASEDMAVWVEWLARSWHLDQAATVTTLINDDTWRLSAQDETASGYRAAGRFSEATALDEQTLADREQILSIDHPNTLTSRNNLGLAYWSAGRYDEAITLHEQALTDMIRVLGPDHPDTLASRNNLAAAYWSAGRYDEAIASAEQVLLDRTRVLGPDHPDTLASRNNLAANYQSAGRYDEAAVLAEQVVASTVCVLGPDHPHTLISRSNLAMAYRSAGRYDEAIILAEQVLDDRVRVLGMDHPDTLISRDILATTYQSAGREKEAAALERKAFHKLRRAK